MPTWSDFVTGRKPDVNGRKCLIVGEVAQAHDGSLGLAHAFVDAIAAAGADAVKFQTHIASAESTAAEPWRVRFSPRDETRYDYWKRIEFTEDEWRGLKRHADDTRLAFVCSPFSIEAVELLERVGVAAWKLASGEAGNLPMVQRLLRNQRPVMLSSGMSPLAETDAAVACVQAADVPLAVLQCTSAYPCPPERVGLNVIPFYRDRYRSAVGLSDHSGTIYPGIAAATYAIDALEVHVTLSREMFGPDVGASVTTTELRQLVEGVRFVERMVEHPVDKDALATDLRPLRDMFTKSVVARTPLAAGTVLTGDHLAVKKPGTGIPAARLPELIGLRLSRDVAADEPLRESDLEAVRSVRL